MKADVVQKSGAWFYYGETRLGQGRDNVKELLKNDDALRNEIEAKLWENVDKLTSRAKKPAKAAAKPVAAEPAPTPAAAPAEKKKKSAKIDILVED